MKLTLDDRLEIVERVWPGTRAKGIAEVLSRVTAEVEHARVLLLERMEPKEAGRA